MKNKVLKIVALVMVILVACTFGLLAFFGYDAEDLGVLKEDATFSISAMKIFEIPIGWALEDSFINLKSDGTCVISIIPKTIYLNGLLEGKEFDSAFIDDISGVYLNALFPGFDLQNVGESFALIEDSLDIKIKGLDVTSEEYIELQNQLQSGDSISNIKLPKGIYIEVETIYTIKKVYSEQLGEHKAVYLGGYDDSYDRETYFIFTLTGKNTKKLKTRVEFLGLEIEASQ